MDNAERGDYGFAAVQAGSPDRNDPFTDAGDAIANVLHYLFTESEADSLDEREAEALSVLDRGRMHFTAEIRGEL